MVKSCRDWEKGIPKQNKKPKKKKKGERDEGKKKKKKKKGPLAVCPSVSFQIYASVMRLFGVKI